jgi:hypothetical protein
LFTVGYRSLDDLREDKLNKLTETQKIGLHFVDDKEKRIPRAEISAIQDIVQSLANDILPGTVATCCGSYRRGKPDSGDCDILLSHADSYHSTQWDRVFNDLLVKMLDILRKSTPPFVTADLTSPNNRSWMGFCKLPEGNPMYSGAFKVSY